MFHKVERGAGNIFDRGEFPARGLLSEGLSDQLRCVKIRIEPEPGPM